MPGLPLATLVPYSTAAAFVSAMAPAFAAEYTLTGNGVALIPRIAKFCGSLLLTSTDVGGEHSGAHADEDPRRRPRHSGSCAGDDRELAF